MTLYHEAARTVSEVREAKQRDLDRAATEARQSHIDAVRRSLREEAEPDDPRYSILALVAETLKIGRDSDGYPAYSLPEDTETVIRAAVEAGILSDNPVTLTENGLVMYRDLFSFQSQHNEWQEDYGAWYAAKAYRVAQKTGL